MATAHGTAQRSVGNNAGLSAGDASSGSRHGHSPGQGISPASRAKDARADELRAGLLKPEAQINPKFLYDAQGCVLFNAICELDEYYPTRIEREIFAQHRQAIAAALPVGLQWVDLGCGDCVKSEGWLGHVQARRYLGVDIAADWVAKEVARLAQQFPTVECVPIGADFTQVFDLRDVLGNVEKIPPVFFYPGSSIGNFKPDAALAMMTEVGKQAGARGSLLISVDLRKDQGIMERAYADALGVTAAFNRNVLRVCNRVLGSDFQPENFQHQSIYDKDEGCIQMRLVARCRQRVQWAGEVRMFEPQEAIVTEHSYKYTLEQFDQLLSAAGFGMRRCWTDPRGWFGVFLAQQ